MKSQSNAYQLNQLKRDQNQVAVQIGTSFQTIDSSDTPKESPVAFSSTIIAITVPDRAVEFIVNPTQDMRISEDPTMASYDVIAKDTKEAIECAVMQTIYIVRDSANGSLNFRFNLI